MFYFMLTDWMYGKENSTYTINVWWDSFYETTQEIIDLSTKETIE